MSLSKVRKEYSITRQLNRETRPRKRKDTFIISDSKGRYLAQQLQREHEGLLKIIHKSGATVDNLQFKREVTSITNLSCSPIVFIWFGTCEITSKNGCLVELRVNPFEVVNRLIVKYRYMRSAIQRHNRGAEVIFLNCPYYSIVRWNEMKGCPTHSIDKYRVQDSELTKVIDYFNDKIDRLNRHTTPKIEQDLVKSSKKRHSSHVKYKNNFNMLTDGIHPGPDLAKLWIERIINLKYRIENRQ